MARGFIRKPSFCKILGALRAQGKRSIMRALFPGIYGKRGMGILNDPKKAAYNWLYNRTSISIYDLFGGKRGGISGFVYSIVYICASIVRIIALPYDIAQCCAKGIKTQRRLKKSITTQKGKGKSNVKKTHRQRLDTPSHKTEDKKEQSFSVDTQTIESVYSMDKNWEKPIYIKEETENTENVPKSVPINPDDQYIKKRMTVRGLECGGRAIIDKLCVGDILELVQEPQNKLDEDVIALYSGEEKIGYMNKEDTPLYVTCIRLSREVYGVVTDVKDGIVEYETWFRSR